MTAGHQLSLPRIERLSLRQFSLFTNKSDITVELGSGVFCLVGANGLGKSTFLTAVNYSLTGIVADHRRKFDSVEEYYRHSLSYSANYFRGRISSADQPVAEIEVTFTAGDHRFIITRGMFEPQALRRLHISTLDGETVHDGSGLASEAARHEIYQEQLVEDVGVSSFEQYAFLQLLVCTFDERRHLIFWDTPVLEHALYLAFGIDPGRAQRADTLRRSADRFESQARNLQYQATVARRRLESLEEKASNIPDIDADLLSRYEQLVTERDESTNDVDRLRSLLIDANLQLASIRADIASTRAEYERAFQERIGALADPRAHQIVTASLASHRCELCGTEGDSVSEVIEQELTQDRCPLCNSQLQHADFDESDAATLRSLDEQLQSLIGDEAAAETEVQNLRMELETASSGLEELLRELSSFEEADALVTQAGMSGGISSLAELRRQYAAEFQDATSRRDQFRRQRNSARAEYRQVREELAAAYADAQTEFVPAFRDLAHSFLGLEVDIQLDLRETGVGFILSIEDTRRREFDQLSESQRFFVDIALRMAIAQHMSRPESPSTLFIDTPEGSLDIAYEARAGSMFALFVERGYHILMTANINTSQLLIRLASRCGSSLMRLERMTEWTSLTDVQIAEEQLFNDAFVDIESALASGGDTR